MISLRLFLKFITLFVVIQSQICEIYPDSFPPIYAYLLAKYEKTKTIYIFGGWEAGDTSSSIYKWNTDGTNGWFKEIDSKCPTDWFYSYSNTAVVIDNIVYFIGVDDDAPINDNIYTFDMDKEVFVSNNVPEPPYPSAEGCLSTNDTHIFMFGGGTAAGYSNQIQIYNVLTQTWSAREIVLTPINNGWTRQICIMVQENNAIYIFGGYEPNDDVYKYDVIVEELTHVDNLPFNIAYAGAVYSSKYQSIYIVGGYNGNEYINSSRRISVFNTHSEKYMYGFDMITNVDEMQAAMVHDQIFAFGGVQGGVQKCNLAVNETRSSASSTFNPTPSPSNNHTTTPTSTPTEQTVSPPTETRWSVAFWIVLALFIVSIISICCIGYKYWTNVSTLNGELEALRINQRMPRYGSNDEQGDEHEHRIM